MDSSCLGLISKIISKTLKMKKHSIFIKLIFLLLFINSVVFATITASGTASISSSSNWMYILSADDGTGNTYWNNTSYYMTCGFTLTGNHNAYQIFIAIDSDGDGDYVYDETWGGAVANAFATGTITTNIDYTWFDNENPSPNFVNDGKKFKMYVKRIDTGNSSNDDTLSLSSTYIFRMSPPSTPGTPDLKVAYDSGTSSIDNETNVTSAQLTVSNVDVSGSNFQIQLIDNYYGFLQ